MKGIKKYLKVILCFMAFAVCSFLLAFAPTLTAQAALEYAQAQYNIAINSIKMPTKLVDVEDGDTLNVPLLNEVFEDTANFTNNYYIIRVIDPAGTNHDYQVGGTANNDEDYFELAQDGKSVKVLPLTNGEYKIVYIVKTEKVENQGLATEKVVGKSYYSNTYSVTVKNVSYELDFSNDNGWINILPAEVKTDAENKIEIPVPSAKVVGGKTDTKYKLLETEISVTKNGAVQKLGENGSIFTKDDSTGKYYIIPSESGVYTIQYTYARGVNRPTKTFTIKVSDNFVNPVDFKVSTTPTIPSMELGQKEITLPKLTAKNEYHTNVSYNVESIKIEKETDSTIYQELVNNDYTFDFTMAAFNASEGKDVTSYKELEGNYVITYTLKDAYGNKATYSKRVTGVTAVTKPKIYLSYEYDVVDNVVQNAEKIVTDASVELKAKYGYDEILLPAAYATDLVTEYKDLTIVRYLRNVNSSTIYYVDNLRYDTNSDTLVPVNEGDTGYNYAALDANNTVGDVSKFTTFKFAKTGTESADFAGTYQLEYRVISNNVKERERYLYTTETGSTRYSFTVLGQATVTDKTTSTVEITNIENGITVATSDKITVNLTKNDDDDSRLKTAVFYYYGTKVATGADIESAIDTVQRAAGYKFNKNVLDTDEILEALHTAGYTNIDNATELTKNSTFEIAFANTESKTGATILAVSYNDYGVASVATKTINFKDTTEKTPADYEVTSLGSFENGSNVHSYLTLNNVEQGKKVTLPTVKFTDKNDAAEAGDANLNLNVMYYINTPETEAGVQYRYPSGKVYANNTITGGYITTSQVGTYYVVYTATDDAGNTSVVYFTFDVVDSSKPVLSVNPTGNDLSISGNTITAEAGATISFDAIVRSGADNSNITKDATITIAVDDNGEELDYSTSGDKDMSYIFNSAGTYTVTISAIVGARQAEDKVIYVNITKPTLKWLEEFDLPEYAEKDSYVYLPDMSANLNAKVTVEVKAPSGASLENGQPEKVVVDGVSLWRFKTNKETKGTYTVTYTATTADSKITKTANIKVGDNVPPVFTMNHEADLKQDIIYDGTNQIEYRLNVNKTNRTFTISASRNGESIYSYDLGLKITDKNDTNGAPSTMSWSDLSYELVGDNVTKGSEDGQYFITGTGKVTIKLSIEDRYDNVAEKTILFEVVEESVVEEDNDTVVGVVLIVISLVVLAGVILFFTFTGKKGNGSKAKKSTKKTSKKSTKTETKVEEKVEETEEVKEDEAKEGVIEE